MERKELLLRALKFYGLPDTYNRIFMPNGNNSLYSMTADAASSRDSYAWVQINLTDPKFPVKKPENQDILIVQNVSLDFEYPENPSASHAVAEEFANWISTVFYSGMNTLLPIEDTGAGAHIVIPVEPINTKIYGGGEVVNTAIKIVIEKYFREEFYNICQDHGVQMSLGAYDISRLLSCPGTWRPPSATKPDAPFLRNGYMRRYRPPFDEMDPDRVECELLRGFIIDATDEAIEIHRNTGVGGSVQSSQNGVSPGSSQHDPVFVKWLKSWSNRNPNASGNRSDYFHRMVCAAYRRMHGSKSIIIDHADIIDDLAGSKYQGRSVAEAQRSILRAQQMAPQTKSKAGHSIQDYIDSFETLGYEFRLNECGHDIEVCGIQMDPGVDAKICNQMYDMGFENESIVRRVWTDLAYTNSYHPVREYLERCGSKYDGGSYIDQVADCFTINADILEQNGDIIARTWLRKWFVGAVAKAIGHEQNVVLVLEGPQGIGKTTLTYWLSRDLPDYHIEEHINLTYRENDTNIRLTRKWLWELGELGATTRRQDVEALKSFLTKRKVTVRKPYGHQDSELFALASFVGTINSDGGGFLSDPTGNRRFAIIPIISIDFKYETFDPSLLWGEAYQAFKSGEDWNITGELVRVRESINQAYYIGDPLVELIPKFFDMGDHVDNKMTGSDIAMVLVKMRILKSVDKSSLTQVGIAMKKLGMKRKMGMNGTYFYDNISMKDIGNIAMNSI